MEVRQFPHWAKTAAIAVVGWCLLTCNTVAAEAAAQCDEPSLVTLREFKVAVRSNDDRPVVEFVPDSAGLLVVSLIRQGIDSVATVSAGAISFEAASPAQQDSEDTLVTSASPGSAIRVSLTPTEVGGQPATVIVRFSRPGELQRSASGPQWRALRLLSSTYALYQTQVRLEERATSATLAAIDTAANSKLRPSADASADWQSVDDSFTQVKSALDGCLAIRPAQKSGQLRRLSAELAMARASLASLKLESWEAAMERAVVAETEARTLGLAESVTRAQILQASALIDGAVESKRSNDASRQQGADLSFQKAVALLNGARTFFERRGRIAGQAYVENYLGAAAHYAGYWDIALRHYDAANRLYERAPVSFRRAVLTQNRALLASDRGDYPEAARLFARAKALIRGSPEPDMLATISENQGVTLSLLGRQDEALAEYAAASSIRRAQGDDGGLARSLLGTGVALMRTGDLRAARPFIEQAWTLRSESRSRDRRGWIASGLARADLLRLLGELSTGRQTLDLIETGVTTPSQRARIAVRRARLSLDEGDYARALAQYEILPTLELPEVHPELSLARAGRLRALIGLGKLDAARAELAATNRTTPRVAGTLPSIEAAYLLAETEGRLGNRDEALARLDSAIAATRRVRATSLSPDSRARFTASRREQDELKICLLAHCPGWAPEAHRSSSVPGAARDTKDIAASLLASEDARARAFAELLSSAAERRAHSSRADVQRGELLGLIDAKLVRLDALSDRPIANAREMAALRESILDAQRRLGKLDAGGDGKPSGSNTPRWGSTELQALVERLPQDTTVLEFFLGRQSALVWVLRRGSLQVHDLAPDAAAISKLRQDIRKLIEASPGDPSLDDQLANLGRKLLEPYVDLSVTNRLFVVPDGELFFVPFASLHITPNGGSRGQALVDSAETVLLPSLSQLLPESASPDIGPTKQVVIVADPVFDSDDARVPRNLVRPVVRTGTASDLARLPATVQEAQAVGRLLPNSRVTLLSGTSATREAVLQAVRPGVAIAHFATHGVIRASDPSLSFLALSAYDREWRAVPSRLYGSDILSSGMRADIVVLSACRSAVGEVVPGEGPMGLSYSFLANGSHSVIAAIWPVPDAFAAEFMRDVYRGLVTERLSPAAALRRAQLQARSSTLWSSPYYWAAFSLTSRAI